jgi:hypothetical protein
VEGGTLNFHVEELEQPRRRESRIRNLRFIVSSL